jgi:KDO2-lipid IV(A) lauroyltransferase
MAKRNIALCFPHLDNSAIDKLVNAHAKHMGRALVDWINAWFWTDEQIKQHMPHRIEGLDILKQDKRGVLLLMKHTAHFFVDSKVLGQYHECAVLAKRASLSRQFQERYYESLTKANKGGVIDPSSPIQLVRALKSGKTVLYAPDHDFGLRDDHGKPLQSGIADFFGVPAATISVPFKLQKATHCRVCMLNSYYDTDNTLVLSIREPTLDKTHQANFCQQMNQEITNDIAQHPHEYMWQYNRFNSFEVGLLLKDYQPFSKQEAQYKALMRAFNTTHRKSYYRGKNTFGYFTVSAWIINETHDQVLLCHDKETNQWLHVGSMSDTISDCLEVGWAALIQAREITGLTSCVAAHTDIFDLHVNRVVSGHIENNRTHCDIRFLLRAESTEKLRMYAKYSLQWIPLADVEAYTINESILRMVEKTQHMANEQQQLNTLTNQANR